MASSRTVLACVFLGIIALSSCQGPPDQLQTREPGCQERGGHGRSRPAEVSASRFSSHDQQQRRRRDAHAQRYLLEHSDPKGTPRPDLLQEAIRQIKQLPIAAGVKRPSGGFTGEAPLSGSSRSPACNGRQIGPAPS